MNASVNQFRLARRAFTLIELLVAISILALLVSIFAQMIFIVYDNFKSGMALVENANSARAILGLMDRDISNSVIRTDLPAFTDALGSPVCRFYTRVSGGNDDRTLSLVEYQFSGSSLDSRLQRLDSGLDFSASLPYGTVLSPPAGFPAVSNDLVPGIVGFKIQFMKGDGTYSDIFKYNFNNPDDINNCKIAIISIAVLDEYSFNLVKSMGGLEYLVDGLADQSSSSNTFSEIWRDKRETLGGNVPKQILANLRFYERSIILPL